MLEEISYILINMSEAEAAAIGPLLLLVGFIVGLVIRRGKTWSMRRVPYFIGTCAVLGLFGALPAASLFFSRTDGEYGEYVVWAILAVMLGGVIAGGVASGILAHARSVNAYGHGGRGWMGIVPILGLVLQFKRPLDWEPRTWGKVARDTAGIILGLFLGGIGVFVGMVANEKANEMSRQAANDPEKGIDWMLRNHGLEASLREVASAVTPYRIDETTTLLRMESSGTILRYVYEILPEFADFPSSTRMDIIAVTCAHEPLHPLIDAGATIEHVYLIPDGTQAGSVAVTRRMCTN